MRSSISLVAVALGATFLCSCDEDLIQVPNNPPVLEMGGPREITRGFSYRIAPERVGDFDGDRLVYEWELTSRPASSSAILENPHSATPTLVPDVVGDYQINVVVSDGHASVDDALLLNAVNEIVGVTWTEVRSDMLTVTNTSGQDCGDCHTVSHTWASGAANLVNPPASSLLTKPVSLSNSGHSYSGRGWSPGQATYELVLDWIEQGAPQN